MRNHPEALLISSVINTGNIKLHQIHGVTNRHFHVYQTEWKWLERHMIRYKKTPSAVTYALKFPDFPLGKVTDVELYSEETIKEHSRFVLSEGIEECLEWLARDDLESALKVLRHGVIQTESSFYHGDSGTFSLLKDTGKVYADVKGKVRIALERGFAGIPTPFRSLNDVTGGWQDGNYVVTAGRTSAGKTWTLTGMALTALQHGIPSLFVTLEQTTHQIAFRFLNILSPLYGQVFTNIGLMSGTGFSLREFSTFLENLKSTTGLGDIHIMDGTRGRISGPILAGAIETIQPEIVFLDYLTLMDTREKAWQDVAKLSNEIQSLAQRYSIPIVAAAQTNRLSVGRNPPSVDKIGLSDSIGQDADIVITLAQQSSRVIKYRLAKFRNGPDNIFWYAMNDPKNGIYKEISHGEAQTLIEQDSDE